ncbi:hypothetical protein PWR63_11050 [Paraburkholderia sp. A2WS-5]|uniref:hypothetical protein n=1 Tax=unclassified Paraburkholderia TaxID=2615204 RepID=UPI003B7EDEDC
MARSRPTRAAAVPGAGKLFALRAIGVVILARWLHSMGDMNFLVALRGMASSPVACLNLIFLFLLIVLPGGKARAERPFHPLPQWLRQALRVFGVLGCLFALWSIGMFVWADGWRRAVQAIEATNGWLVVAPALYAAVVWICRPRALWRTNVAARRFAIGRYAVSVDAVTRTTVVWLESRKVGQYDARELSVRWPADSQPAADAAHFAPVAESATPSALTTPVSSPGRRPKIELLWDSPAAAGHNRQTVLRVRLATEGDRVAARALDAVLKQVRPVVAA